MITTGCKTGKWGRELTDGSAWSVEWRWASLPLTYGGLNILVFVVVVVVEVVSGREEGVFDAPIRASKHGGRRARRWVQARS
jgi:hypothetical protein